MSKTIHVVGDRFSDFIARNELVLGWAALQAALDTQQVPDDATLVVGQGLSQPQLRALLDAIQGSARRVRLAMDERHFASAGALTHKRESRNVMISVPERAAEPDTFESILTLDESCAEMSDHTTGQHLQGMVLIEAARQMFIAVAERFFARPTRPRSYFVINRFQTEFLGFAFPLHTLVRCQINNQSVRPDDVDSFTVLIHFVQNGAIVAQSTVDFAVYPQARLSEKERRKAAAAVGVALAASPQKLAESA